MKMKMTQNNVQLQENDNKIERSEWKISSQDVPDQVPVDHCGDI